MMSMKYLILVGTDFSAVSDLALEGALELASNNPDAEVHVVNVWLQEAERSPGMSSNSLPTVQQLATDLLSYISRRVAAFQERHGTSPTRKVSGHVRIGEAGCEIAQLAADLEADLVVVGTSDRRGVARLLLGSVAQIVSRLAPCPVLIVRPKAIPAPVPAIEPPCPRCTNTRFESQGAQMWCEQHRERHGQRHTYHQGDRVGDETNFPLVLGNGR